MSTRAAVKFKFRHINPRQLVQVETIIATTPPCCLIVTCDWAVPRMGNSGNAIVWCLVWLLLADNIIPLTVSWLSWQWLSWQWLPWQWMSCAYFCLLEDHWNYMTTSHLFGISTQQLNGTGLVNSTEWKALWKISMILEVAMYSITFPWVPKALTTPSRAYGTWGNKWIVNLLLNKQKLKRNEYN